MTVSVDRDGDALILVVSGEVDMASAPRLTAELARCLAERPALLVIDLTAVTFFGSAGLQPLAAAERQAREATGEPVTVRIVASRAVLWVLELTGLVPVLGVYPTRADALAGTGRTGLDDHDD
jgi:anti-anti-sigma factor